MVKEEEKEEHEDVEWEEGRDRRVGEIEGVGEGEE